MGTRARSRSGGRAPASSRGGVTVPGVAIARRIASERYPAGSEDKHKRGMCPDRVLPPRRSPRKDAAHNGRECLARSSRLPGGCGPPSWAAKRVQHAQPVLALFGTPCPPFRGTGAARGAHARRAACYRMRAAGTRWSLPRSTGPATVTRTCPGSRVRAAMRRMSRQPTRADQTTPST